MELWLRILFGVAALCYLLSGVCAVLRKGRCAALSRIVALSGFAAHTCAIAALAAHFSRAPLANPYGLVESIAWAIMALHILAALVLKMRIGEVVAPVFNSVLTGLPVLCPKFMSEISAGGALDFVPGLHALLAVASFAALAFAAGLGAVYIVSRRLRREKSNSGFAKDNPPLAASARIGRGAMFCAAALMAASLLAGIAASTRIEMSAGFALKFCAGAAVFLMMLFFCAFSKKISELAAAKLSIVIFIVSLLLLIPIEIGLRL